MASWDELVLGSVWRDKDGLQVTIVPCVGAEWELTGGTECFWPQADHDDDWKVVKKWVPWVEPIAVGDRVRYREDSRTTYLVVAVDDGLAWCKSWDSRFTFPVSTLRKVTVDE